MGSRVPPAVTITFLPLSILTGQQFDVIDDVAGIRQATDAGDAAGQVSAVGFDEMVAEFFQLGHIILGNGIHIHIAVHGRRD